MNPYRRRILAAAPFSLAVAIAPSVALGQDKVPALGKEYQAISPPQPPESKTRIEVIEFFSYGCPHCFAFEPFIEPWIKQLPPVVLFHRVPVSFFESWVPLARLYYTLESLNEVDRMQGLVFEAVHVKHQRLTTDAAVVDFAEKNGIARKTFTDAYNSFSVQSKMARIPHLMTAYGIEAVPEIVVDGRYLTANTMVGGSHQDVLPIVNYLIAQARTIRKL